ncbi:lyase family protein [Microbacterium sp. P01]|uniref:lyase family protein n=1 Tax=Microbacterium sp. P01 TaxID=3366261 RepID=UPI0036709D57
MSSDDGSAPTPPRTASPPEPFDVGLISPVTVGIDDMVADAAILDALVTAEVALVRAYAALEVAPSAVADDLSTALGWRGVGRTCREHGLDAADLARASVAGGNPVIPLVGLLKERVPAESRGWIHRGATSQDVLDSALMHVAERAATAILVHLQHAQGWIAGFLEANPDEPAAARTLTQHAVPTTIGWRALGWGRALTRAYDRLEAARAALPAQLGGAGGTLASFVEIGGRERAEQLPAAFARQLGLAAPDAPWHTSRWPVTELGDALVQVLDAIGKMAADVATLSRTEIAEVSEGVGGGSSAMPQKQNPTVSVLLRSAAIRAPQLGATLHLASALAVDERPDGAWHAEWPTLRELLRLTLGASSHAAALLSELRVDHDAVARNLRLTRGLIVAERLSIVLTPLIGAGRLAEIVAEASRGTDLGELVRALPESDGIDVDELLDPSHYLGLAASPDPVPETDPETGAAADGVPEAAPHSAPDQETP